MGKKNNTLSIVILTKNEESQIEDCLKTCDFADEIILVDSFSVDKTLEKARKFNVNIFQQDFINFKAQREYAASLVSSNWIFFLDADERINQSLKNTILDFIKQDTYTFLVVPRRNYLLDKWVAHSGWFPDYTGRLVRKDTLMFEDKIVHESLQTTGKSLYLEKATASYLIHYTCDNISSYIKKINHYTSLDALHYYKTNKFKITRLAIFTRSIGMLTQTLFSDKGYKDGMPGFIVAIFNCIYSFLLMVKVWELRKKENING